MTLDEVLPSSSARPSTPEGLPIEQEERQPLLRYYQYTETQPCPFAENNPHLGFKLFPLLISLQVLVAAFASFSCYFHSYEYPLELKGRSASAPGNVVAPTILISLDGFRYEYLSRRKKAGDGTQAPLAPNLHRISTKGVYAVNGLQPVVPTNTKPNHWSLATGLYPESSGIVGNEMYDPVKQKWFSKTRNDPDWYFGSPIWQTIRQTPQVVVAENGTRRTLSENYTTACIFWPGSEVEELAADVFWTYDSSVSYDDRVNRAIALLEGTAPDLGRPAQFVTLYFEAVDHAGHKHGPYSQAMNDAIEKVDKAVGLLLSKLSKRGFEFYNVVVVSDHGMTDISRDRTVDLNSSIRKGTVQDITSTPLGLFMNISILAEELFTNVRKAFEAQGNRATAYLKENLPDRWHLRKSARVTRVVTMADLGWTVMYHHQHLLPRSHELLLDGVVRKVSHKGNHGFDNKYEDMQAIFLAQGPAFKQGATVTGMRAVDLYEMLCHMFSSQPAPNNGSLEITLSSILATD